MSDLNWIWHWPTLELELGISLNAYEYLRSQTQANNENERGGQLFISVENPQGLFIEIATPPHSKDKAGRTWLELDPGRCKEEIIYYNRNGLILVGYWHTHPEPTPHMSGKDIQSFREFSLKNDELLPTPIAIIVGQSTSQDGIRAWSIQHRGPILAKIKQTLITAR